MTPLSTYTNTRLYCNTVTLCLVFMSLANRLEKIVYLLYSRTCLLSDKGSFLFARAYNRAEKIQIIPPCSSDSQFMIYFGIVSQLIAVKRDPEILNSFGGTSVGTSQGGAESSASQDRYIGGPKYIALTAENANLKKHIQEVRIHLLVYIFT